ncbi:hypothetical protein BDR06DRAFT_1003235 [Suillus hirtellus]|nr:hypothetical protein BDR06DRAFT_1003235 [Suillus hirtellus]
MPMQQVEMLQHMWGPPQLASTPPILMQHDGVLQDLTAPVVNAGTTSKKGGSCKRKKPVEEVDGQNNTQRQSNKKKKTNSGAVQLPEAAAVCGVGPVTPVSNPAPESAPADGQHPLLPGNVNQGGSRHPRESRAVATDVWYFLWALNSKERPDRMPEDQPWLSAKPDCKYVACRLCGDDEQNPQWKVWQLRDGMTSCYREHFNSQHHQLWKQICKNMALKTRHQAHHSIGGEQRVFSLEMFHHLLMRWVAVDDQSFNVLECPEFLSYPVFRTYIR